MFTKCQNAGPEHFAYINSLNPQETGFLLSSPFSGEKPGAESLSSLPRSTQVPSGRVVSEAPELSG